MMARERSTSILRIADNISYQSAFTDNICPAIKQYCSNIENFLGVRIQDLREGRRLLEMDMGPMHVVAWEIPAKVLSDTERALINLTRESYNVMWGGTSFKLEERYNEMDGLVLTGNHPYQTYHYIARIDTEGEEPRFVTQRRVGLDLHKIRRSGFSRPLEKLIPDDIGFWKIRHRLTGQEVYLWDRLGSYFEDLGMKIQLVDPRFKIAANHLTAIYPFGVTPKTERQREKTPVGFAAMGLLFTDHPGDTLMACQLCPEFQDVVLTIKNVDGQVVKFDFPRVTTTLGLSDEWVVELDNANPEAVAHKLHYPGYWLNNKGAANALEDLCAAGRLTFADFRPFCQNSYNSADTDEKSEHLREDLVRAGLLNPNQQQLLFLREFLSKDDELVFLQKLVRFATSSRYFKYLVNLYMRDGNINDRLSAQELRDILVYKAGDGPFPSLISPQSWRLSSLRLLEATKIKYER